VTVSHIDTVTGQSAY